MPGWGRRPAGPGGVRRRSPGAADRAAVGCSRSCCPSRAGTPGGSSPAAGGGPSAGSPPGCPGGPASRYPSSAGLRRPGAGVHLTFAQQHPLEAVEGALAPLWWVEGAKQAVIRQGVQEREAAAPCPGGSRPGSAPARSLWRGWCGRHRARRDGHSAGAGRARGSRGRLAIGDGGAFQHPPALGLVRLEQLIDEAGLAHPGLTDHGDHLAVAGLGPLQGLAQGGQLGRGRQSG